MASSKPWYLKILQSLASLRLTVVLLGASVFLVFAGTVAQVDKGVWTVVDDHFRCWFTTFPVKIFFPRSLSIPDALVIPFPGGNLIGVAMLINVLAAHAVRFKVRGRGLSLLTGIAILAGGAVFTGIIIAGLLDKDVAATEGDAYSRVLWRLIKGGGAALILLVGSLLVFRKRAGIVLLHSGLILLLLAEFYTGKLAVESQMRIEEGQRVNWTYNTRRTELVVIDPSDPEVNRVVAVPRSRIEEGESVRHEELPFHLEIVSYMRNSSLHDASSLPEGVVNPATRGDGLRFYARDIPEVTGTDPNQTVDLASAYVRAVDKEDGTSLGTFMLTTYPFFQSRPQVVMVDDKRYDMWLRFERTYKPYAIELLDFRHDRYVGTDTPKDFSSFIRLVDDERGVDREVRIWMNNPLRYRGETMYQQSYDGERTTILQIVRNGSWMIPYISCMIVMVGLMAHFGVHLTGFLRRRQAAA